MTFQIQVLILCTVTLMYKQSAFTFYAHSVYMTRECSNSFSARLFLHVIDILSQNCSCMETKNQNHRKAGEKEKDMNMCPDQLHCSCFL